MWRRIAVTGIVGRFAGSGMMARGLEIRGDPATGVTTQTGTSKHPDYSMREHQRLLL
jgi:hypothetical protein